MAHGTGRLGTVGVGAASVSRWRNWERQQGDTRLKALVLIPELNRATL